MELAELDGFMLTHLDTNPKRASVLVQRFRVAHATSMSLVENADRIVDRSLQRLRKAGKIKPAPKQKGWVVA